MNLLRSELFKIKSTNLWWILLLCGLPLYAVGVLSTYFVDKSVVTDSPGGVDRVDLAADFYTSGQYFGLFFVMLIGTLTITNEYRHQTATTTFLVSPRRSEVVVAKIGATALFALLWWLVTTVGNLVVGAILLPHAIGTHGLDTGKVWTSIGLNGVAYVVWAIFGLGIGVLVRNQIGATLTSAGIYFVGGFATKLGAGLLGVMVGDWVTYVFMVFPAVATTAMMNPVQQEHFPSQWLGIVIMVAYGLVTAAVGTFILNKRDVS